MRVKASSVYAALLGLAAVTTALSSPAQERKAQHAGGSVRSLRFRPPSSLQFASRLSPASRLASTSSLTISASGPLAGAQQAVASGGATPATDTAVRALTAGKPMERELAGGQFHAYAIQLASGQYLHVAVDQRGVDVVVSLAGPDGVRLAEIDSPSGAHGVEPLFWVAESGGTYRVEVRALDKNAPAGKYEIQMDAPRPATTQDGDRIQAQRAYTEGRVSASRATEGSLRMAKLRFQDALAQWQGVGDHERATQTMNFLDVVYPSLVGVLLRKGNGAEAIRSSQEYYEFIISNFGTSSIQLVHPLRLIASLFENQGRYAQAEPMRKEELSLTEKSQPSVAELATSLSDLAQLYVRQAKYAEAEPLLKRALASYEKAEGPDHQDVGGVLMQLGAFYRAQNHYPEAEQVDQRALRIFEKFPGAQDSRLSFALNQLAQDELTQKHYADAEEHEQRALTVLEKARGPEDNRVAPALLDLAAVYMAQKKYAEAEPLYKRALAILDKNQAAATIYATQAVVSLVGFYSLQGRVADAEPYFLRIVSLVEKSPQALKFLQNNATQKNDSNYQFLLGALYDQGRGVKQDSGQALRWYGLAAEQGNPQACNNLGKIYESGLGVPKDAVEAFKWYSVAGTGQAAWEARRKELAAQLSKDQLDEAQRRATEWQKQHPVKL